MNTPVSVDTRANENPVFSICTRVTDQENDLRAGTGREQVTAYQCLCEEYEFAVGRQYVRPVIHKRIQVLNLCNE